MFYVKERISEGAVIQVEIAGDNVYCRCPKCGKEVSVDLAEVLADGDGTLANTAVLCQECARKLWEERNHD